MTPYFTIHPEDSGSIDVDGCAIAYAAWGLQRTPSIVLVHGGGAHMGWWDPVISALSLAPNLRVVALDLSGHGDSGWRVAYSGEQWAADVVGVIDRIGGGSGIVVGHSMGGKVAIVAAGKNPERVVGTVLVDTPVLRPGAPRHVPRIRGGAGRSYQSLEQAVKSFHLVPSEPVLDQRLLQIVATDSFRTDKSQWVLKADPRIYGTIQDPLLLSCLAQDSSPMTFIYGERSPVIDDEVRSVITETHAGSTDQIPVADGFHHLMFGHAAALVDAVTRVALSLRIGYYGAGAINPPTT